MRAEILALRNEHKKLENQMEWAVRAISSERDWTREHTTIHEKDIQELTKEIADTRHLYFNLVAWRRQLVASAAVLGLLFNIALWMIEPAYRWFVERALSRHD